MSASAWFAGLRANPNAEARLFIFPYAGGSPPAFRTWSIDNTETQIVHYPGRGSRYHEPSIRELALMVNGLAQAIQPLLNKPFVFFGHSLGGLVAFELARALRKNNLAQPEILFVSASAAPHLPDPHPPLHKLPDAEFLQALRDHNGTPEEALNNAELMQLLLPTLRADFEAVETYRPASDVAPLACPILAFGGLDDPRIRRDQIEGWARYTASRFETKFFRGDHFFLHTAREEVIESIAAEL